MPLGIEFKNWLRRDVVPTLRRKGYYMMDNQKIDQDAERLYENKFNTEKLESYKVALEAAKIFQPLLEKITKDSTYKFLLLKKLFVEAGIDLPKYIEEELID